MQITNKEVIEALIADFKLMHFSILQPDVRCDFDGDPAVLAQVVKVAGIPTLRFSYRFADNVVSNHTDMFYCLIIAAHELAHWTNAHTKHLDRDDLDSKAIEMWADFFGTRLLFTAVARCKHLAAIINRLSTPAFDAEGSDGLLSPYGEALRQVYDRVFVPAGESPKYPSPAERAQICGTGVPSFFHRHFGELYEGRTIFSLNKVLVEPFSDILEIFSGEMDSEAAEELTFRNVEIHLGLKDGRPLITPGIRPEFNLLVGTHYLGQSESKAHREALKEKIRSWGVEI
ncbi:hypothetical protein [Pseudomonas sp. DCA-1]|uniref:hypothetical protein n=1 Tax=Pseudomonas sp. DCA-1 TaxID=3344874 RepID=UPI00397729C1